MESADFLKGMETRILAGQTRMEKGFTELQSTMAATTTRLETSLDEVKASFQAISAQMAKDKAEVNARVDVMQTVLDEQREMLAELWQLKQEMQFKRSTDLTMVVEARKCTPAGKKEDPEGYLRHVLANHFSYKGLVHNIRTRPFNAGKPRDGKPNDVAEGTKLYNVEFTVESFDAAMKIRMAANTLIKAGHFRSLGLQLTKQERANQTMIKNSRAFQRAKAAAKAADVKTRFVFGSAFIGKEEWSVRKAAAMDAAGGGPSNVV
jgi:hypothetical protein